MDKPMKAGLKTLFLIHAVAGLVFGLGYMVFPATVADLFNMPLTDEPYLRMLGAAILGFAAMSIVAYLAQSWREVKIAVQGELVWTLLAALLSLWFVLNGTWPGIGWLNFVMMAFFFLAFGYFYWQEGRLPAIARPAPRV
jgi:hypothetical protein